MIEEALENQRPELVALLKKLLQFLAAMRQPLSAGELAWLTSGSSDTSLAHCEDV